MRGARTPGGPVAVVMALVLAGCAGGRAGTTGAPTGTGGDGATLSTAPAASRPASPSPADPLRASPSPARTAPPTPVVGAGEPWIVYQAGGIMLVRPDGTGRHSLTSSTAETGPQLHPDWTPDGMRIAFSADAADGTRDIWVAGADGSALERVFDCAAPCAWADDPAWSPDGGELLWQQGTAIDDEGTGVGTLEVLELASGKRRTVFSGAPTEYLYVPRWAPDGTRIVVELERFASAKLDEERVVEATVGTIDLGSRAPAFTSLAPWDSRAGHPDWSPDGTTIVYVQPEPGEPPGSELARSDVWTVPAAGGEPRRLTDYAHAGGRTLQPTWTPDGTAVILVAETEIGQPMGGLVPAAGGAVSRVGEADASMTHPRLRPVP